MPKFVKLTGRFYRKEDGKDVCYGPGSEIEATEEELRKHDEKLTTWKPSDPAYVAEEIPPPVVAKKTLKVKHKEGDIFDVVNENSGKTLNDIPLTREQAEDIVTGSEEPEA